MWTRPARLRTVAFVLIGVAGLLLRGRYQGPGQALVRSYEGNVCVSFAVYFMLTNATARLAYPRLAAAGLALAAVEAFEMFNGFGLMVNTQDPFDFAANAVGIPAACLVDRQTAPGSPSSPGTG